MALQTELKEMNQRGLYEWPLKVFFPSLDSLPWQQNPILYIVKTGISHKADNSTAASENSTQEVRIIKRLFDFSSGRNEHAPPQSAQKHTITSQVYAL